MIGWFCTIVWGSLERDTPNLHFFLCLSAVWFGCINACREIVKERAILERERFFGLSLFSYVYSKFLVLAGLGFIQIVLMQMTVESSIHLKGNMLLQMLSLWGSSLCGTGLGLLVSAFAGTQERAVFAVPLLIIPQMLFSEIAIPKEYFDDIVALVEKLMPVRWSYQVFIHAAADEINWLKLMGSLLVLYLYATLLIILTPIALIPKRDI